MRPVLRTAFAAALALAACGEPASENASTAAGNAAMNGAADRGTRAMTPNLRLANAQQYVALASAGDLFEIQSARIALQKSPSAEVRGLAQMILADHERSAAQLGRIVGEAEPPLTPAPVLDPNQEAAIAALQRARDAAFDREWLRQQVLAHQQALDLAAAYARGGDSEPLRRHAASSIAAIQTHLTRARSLEAEALARPQQ